MTVIISCETSSVAIISSMKALHTQSAATMQTVRQFSQERGAFRTCSIVGTAVSILKVSVVGTSLPTHFGQSFGEFACALVSQPGHGAARVVFDQLRLGG